MVRDWADLLVDVYTQSWKVFISLCLTVALISTLMGLIILSQWHQEKLQMKLCKGWGTNKCPHAAAEPMWFIQVFLDHLGCSGAEESWMPTLARSGQLKYRHWHTQLFRFLIAEVSYEKSNRCGFSYSFKKIKKSFVACCILLKGH